jgi:HEAT repeat protein
LEQDAEPLAVDPAPRALTNRLVSASLLRHHQGEKATAQLQRLGRDSEPTVAAVALARLVELDTKLVVPLLDPVLASSDANVRGFGVEVLFRQPTDAHLRLLGDRLNDAHPAVRTRARQALRQLGSKGEWREAVIREGTRLLGGTDWRGLEQSTILLAQLDHVPTATRLLKLLSHERPEVLVAAGWGLRRLAVPETLPAVLEYFEGQYRLMRELGRSAGRKGGEAALDQQLSHLAQFLGQGRYRPADALLRRMIPPMVGKDANPAGFETRAAAIWALGLIHEGKPVPDLVQVVYGRLTAVRPFDLEDIRVRRMSAVALGRMKATELLDTLREFYHGKPSLDVVNNAVGWAIEQMTGEKVPPPGTIEVTPLNWFLTPVD